METTPNFNFTNNDPKNRFNSANPHGSPDLKGPEVKVEGRLSLRSQGSRSESIISNIPEMLNSSSQVKDNTSISKSNCKNSSSKNALGKLSSDIEPKMQNAGTKIGLLALGEKNKSELIKDENNLEASPYIG